MNKKVFVSGCYDLLHSGHVEFFRQAAAYGDLYVGIGSDDTILKYKNHQTVYKEQERLFMVKSIKSSILVEPYPPLIHIIASTLLSKNILSKSIALISS